MDDKNKFEQELQFWHEMGLIPLMKTDKKRIVVNRIEQIEQWKKEQDRAKQDKNKQMLERYNELIPRIKELMDTAAAAHLAGIPTQPYKMKELGIDTFHITHSVAADGFARTYIGFGDDAIFMNNKDGSITIFMNNKDGSITIHANVQDDKTMDAFSDFLESFDRKEANFYAYIDSIIGRGSSKDVFESRENSVNSPKNTMIEYMYRDADNYKVRSSVVVEGTLTPEEIEDIFKAGEYGFVASDVGLPENKFEDVTEADHDFFELSDIYPTDRPVMEQITANELYEKFMDSKEKWEKAAFKKDISYEDMDR